MATWTADDALLPAYEPVALDVEDRIDSLEGRIERLLREAEGPTLEAAERPRETNAALARRIKALEDEVARLRGAQGKPVGAARDTGRDPDVVRKTPDVGESAWERAKRTIEESLGKVRGLRPALRVKKLAALARTAGNHGLFPLQEELLREVIDTAGRDDPVAQEAAYKIGWARKNAGDPGGAREAWLKADQSLPRDHWRRGYARYYAAEQGAKAGEASAAERELQDLIRDIEANPKVVDRYGTLLERSKSLLTSLGR